VTSVAVALRLRTRSADETRALGASLAAALRPGDVVLLAGDLGAGKTTLTQGIAVGLGVTDPVTSPTFTLVRSHRVDATTAPGVRTLLHADLYRLDRVAEVVDLGLGELVEEGAVAVVEWGDVAAPVLGPDVLVVTLSEDGAPGRDLPGAPGRDPEDERVVILGTQGSWAQRRPELADRLASWVDP